MALRSHSPIDVAAWRSYAHIWTDSLWLIPERDNSGAHSGHYHGNFVPQVPRQLIQRYTRAGDTVLDIFAGSGTTLIEASRLGRHSFGIELLPEVAAEAQGRIDQEPDFCDVRSRILVGDSASRETAAEALAAMGGPADILIAHPPYHDIVRFSERPECLSNQGTVSAFLDAWGNVLANTYQLLRPGGVMALVVGDMYRRKEWVPLGFLAMAKAQARGYLLKSIIVKDMRGSRAKRGGEALWRVRALAGGFYVFRHEYIFIFTKPLRPSILD